MRHVIMRGIFSFSLLELQNGYKTLHGGAVGSLVEVLSTACARTVVPEDKELFLGEISISYLSGTPENVSYLFSALILSSDVHDGTCFFFILRKSNNLSLVAF